MYGILCPSGPDPWLLECFGPPLSLWDFRSRCLFFFLFFFFSLRRWETQTLQRFVGDLKITSTSTEKGKRSQNLAPVLVIISGNSLVFSRKSITSIGFYRCCAPSASAPIVVKNLSPSLCFPRHGCLPSLLAFSRPPRLQVSFLVLKSSVFVWVARTISQWTFLGGVGLVHGSPLTVLTRTFFPKFVIVFFSRLLSLSLSICSVCLSSSGRVCRKCLGANIGVLAKSVCIEWMFLWCCFASVFVLLRGGVPSKAV